MAAPMARGSMTRHSPAPRVISARVVAVLVGSEVPASTSTAPTEARPAAKASQRSCWRSSPRARRNRTASETAAIGTVSNTTARRPGG
jgi:hypothetical protein